METSFDPEPVERANALDDETIRQRTLARVEADLDGFVKRYLAAFGHVLGADNSSELFEEYSQSEAARATRGAAVRPAAVRVLEEVYRRVLDTPVAPGKRTIILFTSGGNGSGKSTSIDPDGLAHAAFDSTLSDFDASVEKIEQALDAGFDVAVHHLSCDPVAAFKAMLARAMSAESAGRTVALEGLMSTHERARDVLQRLAGRYAAARRFRIRVFQNVMKQGLTLRSLDWLRQQTYPCGDGLRATLHGILEDSRRRGVLSEAVYQGVLGVYADRGRARGDRASGD